MYDIKLKFFNRIDWAKNQLIAAHSHSCYELVYYNAVGTCDFETTSFSFLPNTFTIIPPSMMHSELHKIDGYTFFIGFDTDKPLSDEPLLFEDDNSFVQGIIQRIYHEASRKNYGYVDMINALFNQLFIYIDRKNRVTALPHSKDISYLFNYICENFSQKIDIDELTQFTNYSSGHVRKLFREKYGLSPKNFLIDLRLRKSYELITNSTMSCTEISSYCGFADSAQFSKLFKKKYGLSPKKLQYDTQLIKHKNTNRISIKHSPH